MLAILLALWLAHTESTPGVPPYAKWGQMAMQEAKLRYESAAIVDYKHIGRTQLSATTTQERFKLWLRQGGKEFGVYVTIQFDTESERIVAIKWQTADR